MVQHTLTKKKSIFDIARHTICQHASQKHIYMSVLIFLSVIGYNVMRGMKEALILNIPGATAAYIPFIKMMLVLPLSVIFGALYLRNKQKHGLLFTYYFITLSMMGYFICFTYIIVPNMSYFIPNPAWVDSVKLQYPNLQFFVGIIGQWPSALFYSIAELWGTFTLVILFWQTANEIFTSDEAKTFYPILQLVGSFSILSASYVIKYIGGFPSPLNACTLFMSGLASGILILTYLLRHHFPDRNQPQAQTNTAQASTKPKLSLMKSLKLTATCPHILYIALCTCSFGILVNIFDNYLKEIISLYFPGQSGFLNYYSTFTAWKGQLALLANFFTLFYLRKLGWFKMAAVTPFVCIVSLNTFLFISTMSHLGVDLNPMVSVFTQLSGISFGENSGLWYAWICCAAVVVIYAAKYAFFDTTKEMAFIPLPNHIKSTGKAAACGLGGRTGKSLSGLVQLSIFTLSGEITFQAIAPYLLVTCVIISAAWLWALLKLNMSYNSYLKKNTEAPVQVTSTQSSHSEKNIISEEKHTGPKILSTV